PPFRNRGYGSRVSPRAAQPGWQTQHFAYTHAGYGHLPSCLRAQEAADDLTGGGHRHGVDEGDLARVFVRRESRLDEGPDVGGELVAGRKAILEHDEGLDDLGAHRVGLADHGGERHRRMADQAVLDLARSDAVARRRDDVVGAA